MGAVSAVHLFFGLFVGIVTLVVVGFVLVGALILYSAVRGVSQWAADNAQPVEAVPARVVAKRTATSGGGGDSMVSTRYYVTFEGEGGDRQEFGVGGREYGLLAEGDRGTLTRQGTRYKGFQRGPG